MPAASTLLTGPVCGLVLCRAWGAARRNGCGPSGSEPWSGSTRSGSCWRQVAAAALAPPRSTRSGLPAHACHSTSRGLSSPQSGGEPGLLKVSCSAAPTPFDRLQDAIQKSYCLSNLVSRNHAVPLPVLLRMQVGLCSVFSCEASPACHL